jgi:formyl-CoA transferase
MPPRPSREWPPEFGEHTDDVLTEFGFSKDEITQLKTAKVV